MSFLHDLGHVAHTIGHDAGHILHHVKNGLNDITSKGGHVAAGVAEGTWNDLLVKVDHLEHKLNHLNNVIGMMKGEVNNLEDSLYKDAGKLKGLADSFLGATEDFFHHLKDVVEGIAHESSDLSALWDNIKHFGAAIMHGLKVLAQKAADEGMDAIFQVERIIQLHKIYATVLSDLEALPEMAVNVAKKAVDMEQDAFHFLQRQWENAEEVSKEDFTNAVNDFGDVLHDMNALQQEVSGRAIDFLPSKAEMGKVLDIVTGIPSAIWHKLTSIFNLKNILAFFDKIKAFYNDWKANGLRYDKLIITQALVASVKSFIMHTLHTISFDVSVGLVDFIKALVRGGEDSSTVEADADANTGAGGSSYTTIFKGGGLVGGILLFIIGIPLSIMRIFIDTYGAWAS